MKKVNLISFFLLFIASCSSPGQKEMTSNTQQVVETPDAELPVAQIIPKIITRSDASVSYSLFLPADYDKNKRWPLLLLFDAKARGSLPLELYKAVANRNNFILMCSNDSRNGNPTELTSKIVAALITEAVTQYNTDSNMIYTGGFSGGARIAALCAGQNPIVKGVVGISAGFPGNQKPSHSFRFIGIAGKDDFNYQELVQLDDQLSKNGFPHCLLLHNGKHDWCPPDLIDNAMVLLMSDAMREKHIPLNKKLLDECKQENLNVAKQMIADHHYTDASIRYDFILECFNGLDDLKEVELDLNKLLKTTAYQQEEKEIKDELVEENTRVQNLVLSIGRPLSFWEEEVNKIRSQINSSPGSDRSFMLKRVLGGVSVQCYGYAQQLINSNENDKAGYIVALYKLADPENKDPWFFSAILNARNGNHEKAIQDLATSVANGFTDKDRALNEPAFQTLHSQRAFSDLLAKIPSR